MSCDIAAVAVLPESVIISPKDSGAGMCGRVRKVRYRVRKGRSKRSWHAAKSMVNEGVP